MSKSGFEPRLILELKLNHKTLLLLTALPVCSPVWTSLLQLLAAWFRKQRESKLVRHQFLTKQVSDTSPHALDLRLL